MNYNADKSLCMGTRRYLDPSHKNETVTEKLYQTIIGEFFILGTGGKYRHTEGTMFTRKSVESMALPVDKHTADKWLRAHCSRSVNDDLRNEKVLLHLSVHSMAKDRLIELAAGNRVGLSRMVELLVDRC